MFIFENVHRALLLTMCRSPHASGSGSSRSAPIAVRRDNINRYCVTCTRPAFQSAKVSVSATRQRQPEGGVVLAQRGACRSGGVLSRLVAEDSRFVHVCICHSDVREPIESIFQCRGGSASGSWAYHSNSLSNGLAGSASSERGGTFKLNHF